VWGVGWIRKEIERRAIRPSSQVLSREWTLLQVRCHGHVIVHGA
jgi:hypothetical protein